MKRLALSVFLPLALAACGGGSGGGSAATPAPKATPTPPLTAPMQELAGSGVTGTASVVKGTGSFTLTLTVKGLAPNSTHINHIHMGGCPTPAGPIALALQSLVADASGNATATTTINQAYTIPSPGWYANIHAGPDLNGAANAKAISCGNLPPA